MFPGFPVATVPGFPLFLLSFLAKDSFMLTGMTATLTEAFWPCVTDVPFRRTLGIGTTLEMTRFTTDCAGLVCAG